MSTYIQNVLEKNTVKSQKYLDALINYSNFVYKIGKK